METFNHLRILLFMIVGIIVGSLFAPLAVSPRTWVFCLAVCSLLSLAIAYLFRQVCIAQSAAVLTAVCCSGAMLYALERSDGQCSLLDEWVECEAIVVSEPVECERSYGCDLLAVRGDCYKLKAYFAKTSRACSLRLGDRVKCFSRWQAPRDYQISPHFNYKDYLLQHGYCGTMYVAEDCWQSIAPGMVGIGIFDKLRLMALTLRKRMLERFRSCGMASDSFGMMAAMAVGERSFLNSELRGEYAAAGVAHVLALSGMHLSIILGILSVILYPLGRRARGVVQLVFVWLFVFLSGMPVSIVRVALMFSIVLVARMVGAKMHSVNTLSLAALLILTVTPSALFDIGFQLSFVAALSIFLLCDRLLQLFPKRLFVPLPLLRIMVAVVCLSFAAQVGTMPIVLYYFGQLPLYSLLANILVSGLVFVVLLLVVMVLFTGFPSLLLVALDKTVQMMNACVSYISSLPHSTISNIYINMQQVVVLYLVVMVLFFPLLKVKRAIFFA